MPNNPSYIPIFNKAQFDLSGDVSPVQNLPAPGTPWIGELTPDEGEPLVGAILVGPFHAGSMTTEKIWESITLKGEGRAGIIVWVDERKVATGMLTLGRNLRKTNRLKLRRGQRTGTQILALILLQGRVVDIRCAWTPIQGKE